MIQELIIESTRAMALVSCFAFITIYFYSSWSLFDKGYDGTGDFVGSIFGLCYILMTIYFYYEIENIREDLLFFVRCTWIFGFSYFAWQKYEVIKARDLNLYRQEINLTNNKN